MSEALSKQNDSNIIKELNAALQIEEYKFAKEKIRKNEERRFQMITLNVTGLAGLLAIGDKLADWVVPIASIILISICSRLYTSQSLRQKITTAFIIEAYENQSIGLIYEKGLREVDKLNRKPHSESRFIRLLNKVFNILTGPFVLMLMVSLAYSIIQWRKSVFSQIANLEVTIVSAYLSLYAIGISSVLLDVYKLETNKMRVYRNNWHKLLHDKEDDLGG